MVVVVVVLVLVLLAAAAAAARVVGDVIGRYIYRYQRSVIMKFGSVLIQIYMYNDMAVVGCCYVSAGARQREVGDTQCAVCAHVLIMCKDFKL